MLDEKQKLNLKISLDIFQDIGKIKSKILNIKDKKIKLTQIVAACQALILETNLDNGEVHSAIGTINLIITKKMLTALDKSELAAEDKAEELMKHALGVEHD